MALVSAGALASVAAATVSPAFGQATAAGNLLVACVAVKGSSASTTGAPGWTRTPAFILSGSREASIWYKPNCGAGESAPVFNATGATEMRAQLMEFDGHPVAPLDQGDFTAGTTATSVSDDMFGGIDVGADLQVTIVMWSGTLQTRTVAETYGANAVAIPLGNESGTNKVVHASVAYAYTTGNSIPDHITATTTGTVVGSSLAICSFKAAAAPGAMRFSRGDPAPAGRWRT